MFEKVNPKHPDKIADRISGALVDKAYSLSENPRIAVEVLLGHGTCHIICETSQHIEFETVVDIVERITECKEIVVIYDEYPQDVHLANNQKDKIRCGDNGIFKGVPVTEEQKKLSNFVKELFLKYPYDGKFVIEKSNLIACQSNVKTKELEKEIEEECCFNKIKVNPLGDWSGGINVDSGATNRKLGSDMGDSVTGGGLHGKDLSKADVSVNIYAFLKAQETGEEVNLCCAIGDDTIDGKPYSEIVEIAKKYIQEYGGFEKFAEWGFI